VGIDSLFDIAAVIALDQHEAEQLQANIGNRIGLDVVGNVHEFDEVPNG